MTDTGAAGPIASPCTRVCALGRNGVCLGCFRTPDEIAAWPSATEGERRRIVARAASRRPHGTATASMTTMT